MGSKNSSSLRGFHADASFVVVKKAFFVFSAFFSKRNGKAFGK